MAINKNLASTVIETTQTKEIQRLFRKASLVNIPQDQQVTFSSISSERNTQTCDIITESDNRITYVHPGNALISITKSKKEL